MHRTRQSLKTYDIHPISIKLIQKGHPWVTVDRFSENFHPKDKFIVAANNKRPFALLLHDPTNGQVRARVWSTNGNFQNQIKSFKNDLSVRIKTAITKRANSEFIKERNHFYLIFGEGDNIPGILVHYLNGELLIQFYMEFWNPYKDFIIQTLIKCTKEVLKKDISFENLWIQQRSQLKEIAKCSDANTSFRNIEIEEFGVKYKVTIGKYYDHGIYTDMASIRGRLKDRITNSSSMLNLFSYTGAFSLMALSLGVKEVKSVDLSERYLNWLDENIKLNDSMDSAKHESLAIPTLQALKQFVKSGKKFDFIISDPPSSSSDGNKRSNALNDYKESLPLIHSITNIDGEALVFINTHKTSMKKFEDRIKQIIENKKLHFKIEGTYYLSQDCPNKKGFPEGNYLKGLLLKKYD